MMNVLGGMPAEDSILEAEARGQRSMCSGVDLPINTYGTDADFIRAGFTFGANVDDVFRAATMPEGWSKQPTDHSMWSDIVDENGNKRGGIFYKAAFYDRSAHMRLDRRFSIRKDYDLAENYAVEHGVASKYAVSQCSVFDAKQGQPVFVGDCYVLRREARRSALDFLEANYPGWESVHAYWDEEADA